MEQYFEKQFQYFPITEMYFMALISILGCQDCLQRAALHLRIGKFILSRIGKVVRARVCHRSDRRPLKGNPGQKYQLALSLKILCIWIVKNHRVYLVQVKGEQIMFENK